jgi:hypothetical protein
MQSYHITGLDGPLGLQEVEAPRISGQSAHEGCKVASPTHPHVLGDSNFNELIVCGLLYGR